MAIRDVVTMGFGNGTFNGTIPLVTTMGYSIGEGASGGVPAAVINRQRARVLTNRLQTIAWISFWCILV